MYTGTHIQGVYKGVGLDQDHHRTESPLFTAVPDRNDNAATDAHAPEIDDTATYDDAGQMRYLLPELQQQTSSREPQEILTPNSGHPPEKSQNACPEAKAHQRHFRLS